eukprot:575802-Prymnesium_polylepis.1
MISQRSRRPANGATTRRRATTRAYAAANAPRARQVDAAATCDGRATCTGVCVGQRAVLGPDGTLRTRCGGSPPHLGPLSRGLARRAVSSDAPT